MRRFQCFCSLAIGVGVLLVAIGAQAQRSLVIYSNKLESGFQSWSYLCGVNYANPSPTHSADHSISVTNTGSGASMAIQRTTFDSTPYTNLSFWLNGGSNGGQRLQVYATLGSGSQTASNLPPLAADTWQHFTIPLAALGAANKKDLAGFSFKSTASGAQAPFYLDDVGLDPVPAPALVRLNVDAAAAVRTADARWFGMNSGVSDPVLDSPTTTNELARMGCLTLRIPAGSGSDDYHWATGKSGNNTWAWSTTCGNMYHVITNLGMQAIVTVNYGSGTSNEAAGWVRSANVTNHCGLKYWEIGNECYGSWETDSNTPAHDPYTYAYRARDYIQQMTNADPTIKVGVVVTSSEDDFANNTSHPATNPRTGKVHNGWTPVMLATLHSLGVTPDFFVYHYYPEGTLAENDQILLQASGNWASDAAVLRQEITDYLGPAGVNIELLCTENDRESGNQGRQSTSLVNGLYLADTLGHLMQTEFNSYVWCGLQFSGVQTTGSFDPSIYGWRTYGTQGVMSEQVCPAYPDFLTNCYPPYHAFTLMQHFVRPGDTVVKAASDYVLLSAYAARRTNGALTLLVVNKDPVSTFNAQIALTNFSPAATATIYSYGIPQDEAARTNATPAAQGVAGPTDYSGAAAFFTNSFPPYSLTVLTFRPAARTALRLDASPQPSLVGQTVAFTASLSGADGTPGGTVSFYDGGAFLGSNSLSGTTAVFSTSMLGLGAHTNLTAVYSGDASNLGCASPAFSQTVSQLPALSSLSASGNQFVFSFSSLASQNYQVVCKTNLKDPVWTLLGNSIAGTGSFLNVTTGLAGEACFFRVRALP